MSEKEIPVSHESGAFIAAEKKALREKFKKILGKTSKEEFHSQGENASSVLSSSGIWSEYRRVAIFLSTNLEINTKPIIKAALKDGKEIYTPKIKGNMLHFYRLRSLEDPIAFNSFGIGEPVQEEPLMPDTPLLIICPGLAFDKTGGRLGRGKAYYDKYIQYLEESGTSFFSLGLCMDFQIMENIPMSKYDKKMDAILTGSGFL